jgi:oxidase EvaA
MSKQLDFLVSALTEENTFISTSGVVDWVESMRSGKQVRVERIPFSKLEGWSFDADSGNLGHQSGRFFSIEGISVRTNFGPVSEWSQPVINQPEVGILGILAKRFGGVLYFLMQAKFEPGNINIIQLSPTVQATRSNFTRVHEGSAVRYLEYFQDRKRGQVLVDALQSEQGARFLRKRNRNIIVETGEDVPLDDDFCWLTLGQILRLVQIDNMINMDARTVLSCIPFWAPELSNTPVEKICEKLDSVVPGAAKTAARFELDHFGQQVMASALRGDSGHHEIDDIISWFTEMRVQYELDVQSTGLNQVAGWTVTDDAIVHEAGKFFSVIAVEVESETREVSRWTQPVVQPCQQGLIAYVTRPIDGALHFLVQCKVEPGNFDTVEMAPTVQCITGSYGDIKPANRPPFMEYVEESKACRSSTLQSEEGGRFFQEVNRNVIIAADEDFSLEVPDNYIWMTLGQLKEFVRYNNFVNVEGRCLLSCLSLLNTDETGVSA